MSFSKCMDIVNSLDQEDQDAVLEKLDKYQSLGMPAARAQVAAVSDVLAEIKAERQDFTKLVEEQHPEKVEPIQKSKRDQTETPEFKAWFKDSKVVDAQGKPLVVYHGTDEEINAFDKGHLGLAYFSSKKSGAGRYGSSIMKMYLSMQNPYTHDDTLFNPQPDFIANLNRQGYDGIISEGEDRGEKYYIAFNPNQIKSAAGNNGAFDATDPDIAHSNRDLGFYSELAKQIDGASMKQAPAAEWKKFIGALSQKGVKGDEVEWSGVTDWLDLQEGKVAKSDIVDYLAANGVQVNEVVLSNPEDMIEVLNDRMSATYDYGAYYEAGDVYFIDPDGDVVGYKDLPTQLKRMVDEYGQVNGQGAKYEQYTLPGGTNYREVLLTLPSTMKGGWAVMDDDGYVNERYDTEAAAIKAMNDGVGTYVDKITPTTSSDYKSPHWYQANVLAHIRVDDRTDADGAKVLMVQEIQSDWGQDGKKKGFNTPRKGTVEKNGDKYEIHWVDGSVASGYSTEDGAKRDIAKWADHNKTPAGPFVTNTQGWLNLALKRAITMAVEGGYSKVAFVNGEQSADRYDLSKQIQSIKAEMDTDGTYIIYAKNNNGVEVVNKSFPAAELPEAIGKDLADKVIADITSESTPAKTYSGLDLKVGGEGMKTFYNAIVPNATSALLKKLGGGKMDTVSVPDPNKSATPSAGPALDAEIDSIMMDAFGDDVTPNRSKDGFMNQPGFTITPELRKKVEAGVPLFSKRDPYSEAPDSLMGYRKDKPQAAFGEQAYKHVEFIRVSWPNGDSIVEAMTGLNKPHALERARRGWKDAEITAITRDEAEAEDPGIGDSVDGALQHSIRAGTSAWDMFDGSKFDDMVYRLQDKMVDTKRVIESIQKYVGAVADDINVYLQEELFHGRAAKRVTDFAQMELEPLMHEIKAKGLKLADVEEYLHARHAKEANRIIAQRNPNEPAMQDGGSGMTDAQADGYFQNLVPAEELKLNAIAAKVDKIIQETRQLYVAYDLESQSTVDGWGQMFQHYIPLQREDKDGQGSMGIGQGFSVKGKEARGRTGSKRKVVNIMANIALQRERLIVRGEKNRVSNALVGLVSANPNPDFWSIGQPPSERVYDPKSNTVVDRPDPMYKMRANVMVAKVKMANGDVKEIGVVFNEEDPRAMRMVAALKNMDAAKLEGLWGTSAKVTRYFSAINTQYNPVFGVVNVIRDVQGAMLNLGTTPLAGKRKKIAKDTLSAMIGVYQDMRMARSGQQPSSAWSALWDEFQQQGGQTGYRQMFETSEDRAKELESAINPDAWMQGKFGKIFTANGLLAKPASKAAAGASVLFNWLSDYNESMENAVRLSAYKAGLDQGMSKQQAASLAKNLTVNFNRKGQAGQQAGALYAFFNAAMQGSARIGETLFTMEGGDIKTVRLSSTGKKVLAGGMLLGTLQALALAAAGFGDDDPPDFVRDRSLIIPLGGKKYITIPMPLGFNVIPGIGRQATEFALGGFKKPGKRAVQMMGLFADNFNPIGNAGLSMQTFTPTVFDPFVALTENKDFAGRPIARVSSNKAIPGFTQFKDSATTASKMAAEAINSLTGGNAYVAGALSPTPDQIDYLLAQVGGGVVREISKIEQTGLNLVHGESTPIFKLPLFGRFYGNANSQASQGGTFYGNVNRLNELETEVKGLRADKKMAEAAAVMRENPDAYLITQANVAERQISRLKKEKRALVEKGASREVIKAKEEQITSVMARLNAAMAKIKEKA